MKGTTIESGTLMIRFKVKIFSGLGTEVANFTVTEATRRDAEKTVDEWIAVNYPNGCVTYKIS